MSAEQIEELYQEALSSGTWKELKAPDGRVYWANPKTKERVWDLRKELLKRLNAAAAPATPVEPLVQPQEQQPQPVQPKVTQQPNDTTEQQQNPTGEDEAKASTNEEAKEIEAVVIKEQPQQPQQDGPTHRNPKELREELATLQQQVEALQKQVEKEETAAKLLSEDLTSRRIQWSADEKQWSDKVANSLKAFEEKKAAYSLEAASRRRTIALCDEGYSCRNAAECGEEEKLNERLRRAEAEERDLRAAIERQTQNTGEWRNALDMNNQLRARLEALRMTEEASVPASSHESTGASCRPMERQCPQCHCVYRSTTILSPTSTAGSSMSSSRSASLNATSPPPLPIGLSPSPPRTTTSPSSTTSVSYLGSPFPKPGSGGFADPVTVQPTERECKVLIEFKQQQRKQYVYDESAIDEKELQHIGEELERIGDHHPGYWCGGKCRRVLKWLKFPVIPPTLAVRAKMKSQSKK